ncbi:MAG: orotidine-5'-phosphate decarboxylase [Cryomorphaceae bacterium]|nr:orotidine-5'-phosphate decarboxylase [Cryomorphaceae bacterium]
MERTNLIKIIQKKRSVLCVGLDTDLTKIPKHLLADDDPMFAFNKSIIDATEPYAVAYKPNIAFYEAEGESGWKSLKKTVNYIRDNYPDVFLIADAKRGDIGNTAERYAHTFFNLYDFDAVTLSPYMGHDSISPFVKNAGKWAIVLGLTSNKGAQDIQMLESDQGDKVYQKVMKSVASWGSPESIMFVVGATNEAQLAGIRDSFPEHFFLIPGVGAQGGDLNTVLKNTFIRNEGGVLINSSRGIIYASSGRDFAGAAAENAKEMVEDMTKFF